MSEELCSMYSDLSESTTSLFSVLDHDSFNEETSDSDDIDLFVISPVRVVRSEQPDETTHLSSKNDSRITNSTQDLPLGEEYTSETFEQSQSPTPGLNKELSGWEKWFVKKVVEERRLRRKKQMLEKQKQKLKEEEKKKINERRIQYKDKYEKQLKTEKAKVQRMHANLEMEKEKEHAKTEKKRAEAAANFREWINKKQHEAFKQHKLQKQKDCILKQMDAQKKLVAKQAFNDWLLAKKIDQNSRIFPSPPPEVGLRCWRNSENANFDSFSRDFSTRLFISS